MKVKAILFDTRSIQRYIFSGSQLKTNIGASYLVDRVFDEALLTVLRDSWDGEVDTESWRSSRSGVFDWSMKPRQVRIGYIGGGNALVLFPEDTGEAQLAAIVTAFTKRLLVDYPGLQTGAAIGDLQMDTSGLLTVSEGINDLTRLVHQLKQHQNTVFPQVNIAYTGLTLSCKSNGETASAYDKTLGGFVSWELESKLRAEGKAEQALVDRLEEVWQAEGNADLMAGAAFPAELSKLGQRETENDIAIVHIDGNNMGAKFAGCDTLTKRKNMSLDIREKTMRAFCHLVDSIQQEIEQDTFLKVNLNWDGRRLLPIRPLVLGGDDMTFICAAKVALRYAERVMESMRQAGIDTCAGIAILNTSYPFFRGYTLAEQLCDAAKGKMRSLAQADGAAKDKGSCWLDFAILHGEQAPTLEQIRRQEYTSSDGRNLHFGPYRVDADPGEAEAWSNLKQALYEIHWSKRKMPMGKIKELRSVITRSEHERTKFIEQLGKLSTEKRPMQLPSVPAWAPYEKDLWDKDRTPYVDAIELIDYYEPEGAGSNENE
ncbi:MAG: hypothetical protein LKE51_12900 [Selenomonas sp.]|jgi:hypothetical protein|nr:hypothetical protein [Selenomonas sp.]